MIKVNFHGHVIEFDNVSEARDFISGTVPVSTPAIVPTKVKRAPWGSISRKKKKAVRAAGENRASYHRRIKGKRVNYSSWLPEEIAHIVQHIDIGPAALARASALKARHTASSIYQQIWKMTHFPKKCHLNDNDIAIMKAYAARTSVENVDTSGVSPESSRTNFFDTIPQ